MTQQPILPHFRAHAWPLLLVLALLIATACAASPTTDDGRSTAITRQRSASATLAPSPTVEPSATPTATPAPSPTATVVPSATPSPTPAGLSEAELAEMRPNELGWALVMEYHLIEPGEDAEYSRTPDSLRADLAWLYDNGYYPITFRDLASANFDSVPAGRSPVVLTFDDSSIGQYNILADGSIDPESAMGILLAFHKAHPDFPPIATWFPLLEVDVPSRILWGQPEWVDQKLQHILELGGEIGSHTVTHNRLDQLEESQIQWQLGTSQRTLEERIGGGYDVVSLALPLGIYPANEALIQAGTVDGVPYGYLYAAEVAGGMTVVPYAASWDPIHIARAPAAAGYIDALMGQIERRPSLKYISDGGPTTLTFPSEATLDEEQQGTFDAARWPDLVVRRYDRALSDE